MQGKCSSCKVRYIWKTPTPLSAMRCPVCRGWLKRTSHLSHLPLKTMPAPAPPERTNRFPHNVYLPRKPGTGGAQ